MPRGISWSFNETDALIRLWADSTTQTALRLNSRNRCIYEDIASQLQAIGITRTADRKFKGILCIENTSSYSVQNVK